MGERGSSGAPGADFSDEDSGSALRRTCWSPEEDVKLIQLVETYGPQNWSLIARSLGSGRNGKSCRLRWFNQLDPKLRKEPFTPEEEEIIVSRHAEFGNRWAAISRHLPGRTDNAIKNHWNGHLKKRIQARQAAGAPAHGAGSLLGHRPSLHGSSTQFTSRPPLALTPQRSGSGPRPNIGLALGLGGGRGGDALGLPGPRSGESLGLLAAAAPLPAGPATAAARSGALESSAPHGLSVGRLVTGSGSGSFFQWEDGSQGSARAGSSGIAGSAATAGRSTTPREAAAAATPGAARQAPSYAYQTASTSGPAAHQAAAAAPPLAHQLSHASLLARQGSSVAASSGPTGVGELGPDTAGARHPRYLLDGLASDLSHAGRLQALAGAALELPSALSPVEAEGGDADPAEPGTRGVKSETPETSPGTAAAAAFGPGPGPEGELYSPRVATTSLATLLASPLASFPSLSSRSGGRHGGAAPSRDLAAAGSARRRAECPGVAATVAGPVPTAGATAPRGAGGSPSHPVSPGGAASGLAQASATSADSHLTLADPARPRPGARARASSPSRTAAALDGLLAVLLGTQGPAPAEGDSAEPEGASPAPSRTPAPAASLPSHSMDDDATDGETTGDEAGDGEARRKATVRARTSAAVGASLRPDRSLPPAAPSLPLPLLHRASLSVDEEDEGVALERSSFVSSFRGAFAALTGAEAAARAGGVADGHGDIDMGEAEGRGFDADGDDAGAAPGARKRGRDSEAEAEAEGREAEEPGLARARHGDAWAPPAPPGAEARLDPASQQALLLGRVLLGMSSLVPGVATVVAALQGMVAGPPTPVAHAPSGHAASLPGLGGEGLGGAGGGDVFTPEPFSGALLGAGPVGAGPEPARTGAPTRAAAGPPPQRSSARQRAASARRRSLDGEEGTGAGAPASAEPQVTAPRTVSPPRFLRTSFGELLSARAAGDQPRGEAVQVDALELAVAGGGGGPLSPGSSGEQLETPDKADGATLSPSRYHLLRMRSAQNAHADPLSFLALAASLHPR